MEFKYRAIDNVKPATTLPFLSPAKYLPNGSVQMNHGFSGFRPPLTGEEALWRELEKEVIRREILRRMELEEEVRRELAIERQLGISTQRPLNIHGLLSQWSNSTSMNPVAAVGQIGASQPQLILPPTAINPSPEISNKDKVIVLDRPDPELFYAKRKTTTLVDSETEPSTIGLKKKRKEEWSCALCEIKTTSESGLKAHLNGKKHKIKEARQNKKICQSNVTSEKIVNLKAIETSLIYTKLEGDVQKDQHEQHPQPCMPLEVMDATIIDKGIQEPKQEEQLLAKMTDYSVSATKSTNEKELVEVCNDVTEPQNEKSEFVGCLASNKDAATEEVQKEDAATEEVEKKSALTKRKKDEILWCEICDISTFSKVVMEGHIKGKKHMKKMKIFEQNSQSPSTCSVESVSTKAPELIKYTQP
ncbi:uncharacterized protein LOC131629643 [Vicia villosa]|uniref:uncharacterized protein LOC131629643 n=1 Tax=Vicia villosa TaxID=3911 RepID=UPI00273B707E|nr:uncharacterized protein LOC131629643 [Vicia villosa]